MALVSEKVGASVMENREESSYFKALARQIRDGECVLVLGPGASTDSNDSTEVSLNVKLARQWAAKLRDEDTKDLDTDDLRYVGQVLLNRRIRDLFRLQDDVAEFYKQFSGKTTEFHRNIAALPFKLCITTSPDDFIFEALRKADKSPVRDFYNFAGQRRAEPAEPAPTSPLVYHLYGYPDEPQSLVITENDLIDFLFRVVRDDPPLPKSITGRLNRSNSSCLFVDLGFKNWYLRVLMRSLGLGPDQPRMTKSVALEKDEFFKYPKEHQTTIYFSGSTSIEFHQGSLNDFALKLRQQYELMTAPGQQPSNQATPGAPKVFVSYASEDRQLVEDLAGKLGSAGIAVWQDKQKLQAGDDWEQKLIYVIDNLVNYVIVVQTDAMLQRSEGVFFQEIQKALKRQERFREGVHFVIPVRTTNGNLKELKHLHSITINTSEGIQAVVRSILDDWSGRASLERAIAA